jgi:hypothetical protein
MNLEDKQGRPESQVAKRPYYTPVLLEYGSVSKLVQGGSGSGADAGVAGMHMVCL